MINTAGVPTTERGNAGSLIRPREPSNGAKGLERSVAGFSSSHK
jgi:hypothetical protein